MGESPQLPNSFSNYSYRTALLGPIPVFASHNYLPFLVSGPTKEQIAVGSVTILIPSQCRSSDVSSNPSQQSGGRPKPASSFRWTRDQTRALAKTIRHEEGGTDGTTTHAVLARSAISRYPRVLGVISENQVEIR